MRKILLLTAVLFTGIFSNLSAQGEWINWTDWTTDTESYTINAISFDFSYANYGAIFTENKETGKGGVFFHMGSLNSLYKGDEYESGLTGYSQGGNYIYVFGKSGTLLVNAYGNSSNWSKIILPEEFNQVDFTAGVFRPIPGGSYLNFTAVLTDGSHLYYSHYDEATRNQSWGKASTDNPIEEIKEIKYNEYDEKFYAVGTGGQIFFSANNGQNWELAQTNLTSETITSLAFINTGEENIIVLAGYLTKENPAVYRTTDLTQISLIQTFQNAGSFNKFVYSSNENVYYLLSKKGMIIKSLNNGTDWEIVRESQTQEDIYNTLTILPGVESFAIYAGGKNGLLEVFVPDMVADFDIIPTDKTNVFDFQSNSSGLITNYEWEFEDALFPYDNNNPNQPDVFFNTSGTKTIKLTVKAGLPTGDITKEVIKTIDVVTDFDWQLLNSGSYTNNDIVFPGNQNKIGYIAQQSSDNDHNGVLKTINGGKDWIEVLSTATQSATNDEEEIIIRAAYALSFPTVNTGYVCIQGISSYAPPITTAEIWKTTNGGESWQELELPADLGLSKTNFYSIHFWNENEGIAFHDDVIIVTSDGGKNWAQSMLTEIIQEGNEQVTPFNQAKKYAVASENTLYGISNVNTIRMGPTTISSADIYKSEDKGANWIKISTIDTDGLVTGATINISFSDEENGVVVASSSVSTQFSYTTADGGMTWETHTMTADYVVTCLHHANDSLLFAAGNSQLLIRSENGGVTWTNENQPLNNGKSLSNLLNFTSTSTGAVFVSGENGVIKRYSPELKADFEIIANEDSTYVTFKNNSIGFITDFKWEVNGTIESEDCVIEKLELIRPNTYTITLTVSAEGYQESSHTKEFVLTGCNPEKSTDPSPTDEEQLEVWENIDLSWKNETCQDGGNITYSVQFGTSEADLEQLVTDLTETTYKVDKKLEQETVYYWRIDATNNYATIQGDIWSFTTGKETNAIKENLVDQRISISPNPFNDSFTIYVNNKGVDRVEVQLNDLQGRTVYSQVFTGNETITVNNLTGISSGVYVGIVKADNTVSVQKIVKQ